MGLGSAIPKKSIPDPKVKKAPGPGSGSATLWQSKRILCKKERQKTDSERETWYGTGRGKVTERMKEDLR
jgi:hypothetical protein